MKDICYINDLECLKYVICRELKEVGIKVPKDKKSNQDNVTTVGVFGNRLGNVPTVVSDQETGFTSTLPKFLVEAVGFLEKHLTLEGLFRKSGSLARQKELKQRIQDGESIPNDAKAYDVAALFKQFFRELADPLLTTRYHDTFIKCYNLEDATERENAILLLCNALPLCNIKTLQYVVKFLARVAAQCQINKMDASNLAVVLAPNFMGNIEKSEKMKTPPEKLIQARTCIIQHLISNAEKIGQIPENIVSRVEAMNTKSASYSCDGLTSEDDLDGSRDMLDKKKSKRKKRRSGSISGIVNGLGQSLGLLKSSNSNYNVAKTPQAECDDNSVFDHLVCSPHDSIVTAGETPTIRGSIKRKNEEYGAFSSAKRKAMLHQLTSDPRYSKQGIHIHKSTPVGLSTPVTPLRAQGLALGEGSSAGDMHGFMSPTIRYADESIGSVYSSPSVRPLDESGDILLDSTLTPSKKKFKLKSKKVKRRSSSNVGSGCFSPKADSKRRSIRLRLRQRCSSVQETPPLGKNKDSVGWRLANGPPSVGLDTLNYNPFDKEQASKSSSVKSKGIFKKHHKTPSSPGRLVTMNMSLLSESPTVVSNTDPFIIENTQVTHPPSPSTKYKMKSQVASLKSKEEEKASNSPKVVTIDVHMKSPGKPQINHNTSRILVQRTGTEQSGKSHGSPHIISKPPMSGQRHKINKAMSNEVKSPLQRKKEQLALKRKQVLQSEKQTHANIDHAEPKQKQRVIRASSLPENINIVTKSDQTPKPHNTVTVSKSLPEHLEVGSAQLPPKMKSEMQTTQGRPILTASVSFPEAICQVIEPGDVKKSQSCQSISSILSESNTPGPKESNTCSKYKNSSCDQDNQKEEQNKRIYESQDVTQQETEMIMTGKVEAAVSESTGKSESYRRRIQKSASVDSGKGVSMFDLTEIGRPENEDVCGHSAKLEKGRGMDVHCDVVGAAPGKWEQRNVSLDSVDSALDSTMEDDLSHHTGTDNIKSRRMDTPLKTPNKAILSEEINQLLISSPLGKDESSSENLEPSEDLSAEKCCPKIKSSIGNAILPHAQSCADIWKMSSFVEDDDERPGKFVRSNTLPERRPPRKDGSSSNLNSSLVQRHIEHFNAINAAEISSPLRVAKCPLAFRRAPNRASARFSTAQKDEIIKDIEKSKTMKKANSDQSLTRPARLPITSTLVKSISTDSGMSKFACVRKESHDHNESYEEAIASFKPCITLPTAKAKIPKALQETINETCTLRSDKTTSSPLKEINFSQGSARKMTPMRELPKKFVLTSQPLTPLQLASKTRVRTPARKVIKPGSPLKAVKRLTPRRSPSFKLDQPTVTPTNRPSRAFRNSPRYPKSPKSPAKMVVGGKIAMFPHQVCQDF